MSVYYRVRQRAAVKSLRLPAPYSPLVDVVMEIEPYEQ